MVVRSCLTASSFPPASSKREKNSTFLSDALSCHSHLLHHLGLLSDGLLRDKGRSNLLRDPPGFSVLYVSMPDLVQNLGLARVHMSQDTHHRGAEDVQGTLLFMPLATVLREKEDKKCKKEMPADVHLIPTIY